MLNIHLIIKTIEIQLILAMQETKSLVRLGLFRILRIEILRSWIIDKILSVRTLCKRMTSTSIKKQKWDLLLYMTKIILSFSWSSSQRRSQGRQPTKVVLKEFSKAIKIICFKTSMEKEIFLIKNHMFL